MAEKQIVPKDIQDEALKASFEAYDYDVEDSRDGDMQAMRESNLNRAYRQGYIAGAMNERAKKNTYIPLICSKNDVIYTWTTSSEGGHWIDDNGNGCDIDIDNCKIIEVKLSNNQVITERAKGIWTDADMIAFAEFIDSHVEPTGLFEEYKKNRPA